MTTTTIDYTDVDDTKNGTAYQSALKLQFQNAQADMVLKPNVADAETISGAWTYTAKVDISDGGTNVPLKVKLNAGGTADIFQVYDDATKVFYVDSSGRTRLVEQSIADTGTSTSLYVDKTGVSGDILSIRQAGSVKLKVSYAGVTTSSDLVGTKFSMGDITTPIVTHATGVDPTLGETLGITQSTLDVVITALINVGIIKAA